MKEDEEEEELQQLDYKDTSDACSVCSELTELDDDYDIADPNDWFLEEEMEDEPKFYILEKGEIEQRRNNIIDSTAAQLNLDPADAALVLQHFNWDTELMLRKYFDCPDMYLQEAGLFVRTSSTPSTQQAIYCAICLEDKTCSLFFALGCGHSYCSDCWREYIHQSISLLGPDIVNITCMYPKCRAKLNFTMVEKLADTSDFKRYRYFLLKHFAESDPHIRYCPNPTCGNAVLYQGDGRPTDVVECHCGTRFCFSCGYEKHNPVTCEQLKMWLDLLQDDSESVTLIKATSKPCFHCGLPTERVTGCNHMTCRKEIGGCGGEWCWMCRGDWGTHGPHTGGFYSCNKYDHSEAKKLDEESNEYMQKSSRLIHYFTRYFNHDLLMKNGQKMLIEGEVEKKMGKFLDITGYYPDFFMEAAELLVECRRMLKYTYVYGYFMESSPNKSLFEYQQASAEGITERLAELFGTPVEDLALDGTSLELVNYIRVAKKYISNLIKSIEDGFDTNTEDEYL